MCSQSRSNMCHCVINSPLSLSVPHTFNTYLCDVCTTKPHVDSPANYLDSQRTASISFGKDKHVFVLTIAAVLSALPLHILVVFSDKAGQSAAGLRGLQCRGEWRQAGSKKKIGGDLSGETEKCWRRDWLFVCLSVRCWTVVNVVRSVLSIQTCAIAVKNQKLSVTILNVKPSLTFNIVMPNHLVVLSSHFLFAEERHVLNSTSRFFIT